MHKNVMPTVWFLGAIILELLVHFIVPLFKYINGGLRLLGLIPLLGGIAVNIWADNQFKLKKTAVRTDLNPSAIILSGPFTFTRNPMYLGMAWSLFGISMLFGTIMTLLGVAAFIFVMDRLYIPHEEQKMTARFGEQYRLYSKRVRRWM